MSNLPLLKGFRLPSVLGPLVVFFLIFAIGTSCICASAPPRLAEWRNVTPGFLNVGHDADIQGDTITILTDIGGVLRSDDAGKTWRAISHMGPGEVTNKTFAPLAVRPGDTNVILFGGSYVYRTEDGGARWHECVDAPFPEPRWGTRSNQISCIKFTACGAAVFCGIGTDPLRPKRDWEKMHAAFHAGKTIYRSTDNGRIWTRFEIASGAHVPMRALITDPKQENVVCAAFDDGTLYRSENALDERPVFKLIHTFRDTRVGSAAISPFDSNIMLGTLVAVGGARGKEPGAAALFRTDTLVSSELQFKITPVNRLDGKNLTLIKNARPGTLSFDPSKKGRVAVGLFGNPHILFSEDDGITFTCKSLPERHWKDIRQPQFFGNIERVYFGPGADYALSLSYIGAFKSDARLDKFETLLMDVRDGALLGNTGAATAANINEITIGGDYVYWSAQDHGAWRAARKQETHWRHITSHDDHDYLPKQRTTWGETGWFWKVVGVYAPPSGATVFVVAVSWQDYSKLTFAGRKHVYRSDDAGRTWRDVTIVFENTGELPAGGTLRKMVFAPVPSKQVWLLLDNALYHSVDSGESFRQAGASTLPRFDAGGRTGFTDMAFNERTGELLLGIGNRHALPDGAEQTSWLYGSRDYGETWQPAGTLELQDIQAIAAAKNGDWIIGTGATKQKPARLMRFTKSQTTTTLMTLGDNNLERNACQLAFYPVIADGASLLVYANTKWFHSDRIHGKGAYLSIDDGVNWHQIGKELPSTNIWSAAMRDGVVYIGTTFGLMRTEILATQEKQ